jgi:hypothetical protein
LADNSGAMRTFRARKIRARTVWNSSKVMRDVPSRRLRIHGG